jgi:hypothetical protein
MKVRSSRLRAGLVVAACSLSPAIGCGARSGLWFGDGSLGGAGAGRGGQAGASSDVRSATEPQLCVFDYDLTLSSHDCPATVNQEAYFCRDNRCQTYDWYTQCLAIAARKAIAECVQRHAYVAIASKADVDLCWSDKVKPITEQGQFPELTLSPYYVSSDPGLSYPAIDDRTNWNCANCAYSMDGWLSKPDGIGRAMRHYGLDPELQRDRARVIFWDDTPENIDDVRSAMPEARAILVPRFSADPNEGGCGITEKEIAAGWEPSSR